MLKNKKIIIAGAGGLLGASLVARGIELGAKIIAIDLNENVLMDSLKGSGVDINSEYLECIELDLTNESDVKSFFSNLNDIHGAVNLSYPRNNEYGKHFFDVSMKSFNENLSLHLGSAFLFMQQCAKLFARTRKEFSLVNTSSIYGVITPRFSIYENTEMTTAVEYPAIKSAILHLSQYTSKYVNNSKFRVNCVSPGGILAGQPDSFLQAYKSFTNGKGMLDTQDILGAITFLLSDMSKYVTGQNIVIDDGFTL